MGTITESKQQAFDNDILIKIGMLATQIEELMCPCKENSPASILPTLTIQQKKEIKDLMQVYFDNKSLFIYGGDCRRLSYAYPEKIDVKSGSIYGCMDSNSKKYILNCGVFAQMIWMGRTIDDFKKTKPSSYITTAFDWGYYFDFLSAKVAYGKKRKDGTYYAANTYFNDAGTRRFTTFDNAAAMAQELYRKGFEIPYSSVDIGDMVFYRSSDISDNEKDELEQSSFRYITHVGLVYDITEFGPTILECTSVYSAALGRCGLGPDTTVFGNVRGADQENRVIMAARHPAAFGIAGNVPEKFDKYR